MSAPPGAVLDACVLFPSVLREILLGVAAAGRFLPLWSDRLLAEWAIAAGRAGPVAALQAKGEIALVRAGWPEAAVPADPGLEARLWLPDPADRHVLAAAITGGAGLIVTRNLRDFPRAALQDHGITALSPDDFLMRLWLEDSPPVAAAVARAQAATEAHSGRAQPLRPLLRRAGLPRLGKALDSFD